MTYKDQMQRNLDEAGIESGHSGRDCIIAHICHLRFSLGRLLSEVINNRTCPFANPRRLETLHARPPVARRQESYRISVRGPRGSYGSAEYSPTFHDDSLTSYGQSGLEITPRPESRRPRSGRTG